MTDLRKAYPDDFDAAYPLLAAFNNPNLGQTEWQRLFQPRWRSPYEHIGYLLEDGGRAVGFMAAIYAKRPLKARQEVFCSLSSWRVLPPYRQESLGMLVAALKEPGVTYTDFTGNKVAPLLRSFGFRQLGEQYYILLPLPTWAGVTHGCRLVWEGAEIEAGLSGGALQTYHDHADMLCRHALLQTPDGNCHLIYRPAYKKRLPVAQVLYLSDRAVFQRHAAHAATAFCLRERVAGLMVNGHMLTQPPAAALTVPQRQSFLFRSKSVLPEEMDYLYSELVLLGVS
ncbi:MAG: hypothetical protein HPY76_10420 [Anaerolineae bacterium]|nr:hypothetical protein [Anaerolineae bacterium]